MVFYVHAVINLTQKVNKQTIEAKHCSGKTHVKMYRVIQLRVSQ